MRRSLPRLTLLMLLPLAATGCWKQPGTAGLPCSSESECDDGQQCVAGLCEADTDSPGETDAGATTTMSSATEDATTLATSASGATTTTTSASETSTGVATDTVDPTTGATTGTESECPSDPSCLPSPDWALAIGETGSQVTVKDIAIDGTGAAIVAGNFTGSILLPGEHKLDAPLEQRIFLIKFMPNGTVAWAFAAGDSLGDEIRAIAIDPESDSIYATGAFFETIDFGGQSIIRPPTGADLYLARLKPDGTQDQLVGWGEQLNQFGNDIMVLSSGDVVVAGMYQGDLKLGVEVLVEETGANSSYNAFIARFDDSFSHVWSRGLGLPDLDDRGAFVQPAPDDTIYFGGTFTSKLVFPGGPTLDNADQQDGFVARLDAGGMTDWAFPIASTGNVNMNDIVSDEDSVYVLGSTNGTVQASADVTLVSAGLYDIFALALNSDASVRWGETYGAPASDELGGALAVDAPRGHALLTGMCRNGTSFGDFDDALSIVGNSDMCFARLRADMGAHVASARYGGKEPEPPGSFEFGGRLATRGDALYMSGTFFGEMTIGADELMHPGMMYARPWVGRFGL